VQRSSSSRDKRRYVHIHKLTHSNIDVEGSRVIHRAATATTEQSLSGKCIIYLIILFFRGVPLQPSKHPSCSRIRRTRLIIPNFHIFSCDFYYRLSKVIGVTKYKKTGQPSLRIYLNYYYYFFFLIRGSFKCVVLRRFAQPFGSKPLYAHTLFLYDDDNDDDDDAIYHPPCCSLFSQAINHRKCFRRRVQNVLEPSGHSAYAYREDH
jgi:hypothetical protein